MSESGVARSDTLTIAVIADSHDLLRPSVLEWLGEADEILHAGDLCSSAVLEQLQRIAPTTAVRGNNDHGAWAGQLSDALTIARAGVVIHLCHIREATRAPDAAQLIINGHSHKPAQEQRNGQIWLNPGAIGRRRFNFPIAAAQLRIAGGQCTIHEVRFEQ